MQPAVYTALRARARAGWPIKAPRHSMKPIRSLMFPKGSRYCARASDYVCAVHVCTVCLHVCDRASLLTSSFPTLNWILMLTINWAALAVYNLNTTRTWSARVAAQFVRINYEPGESVGERRGNQCASRFKQIIISFEISMKRRRA